MGCSNSTQRQRENNNENNENNNIPKGREIDLSPEEIQNLMESEANLRDKVNDLNKTNTYLQEQLNIYKNNNAIIQNNLQNINKSATLNLNQARQQIDLLQNQNLLYKNQNDLFQKQILQLEQTVKNLNHENNVLKFSCNKMQIMLLNHMQEISMNNNINSMQSLNSTPMNNINNMNNNMNNQNFNNQKTANSLNLIFNINNKIRFPISTLPNHKLGNVFILALYQNGYTNFVNIRTFKFRYNTHDISNLFYENKEVKDFHFNLGFPVVEVDGNL